MYKLLIVDDEVLSRRGLISSIDWELLDIELVGEAENGLEARTLITERRPDIVICDVMMPHLDGLSLVADIRDLYPAIQYIFLSGYSQAKYLKKALTLSAIDYIFKPFSKTEMLDAIARAKHECQKHKDLTKRNSNDLGLELMHPSANNRYLDPSKLPIKLEDKLQTFIVYFADDYEELNHKITDREIYFRDLRTKIRPLLDQELSRLFHGRFLLSALDRSFLVHVSLTENSCSPRTVVHDIHSLLNLFGETQTAVCIGSSALYQGRENMLHAYREARDAVKLAFLRNYGTVVLWPDKRADHFAARADFVCTFLSKLESNDISEGIRMLDSYISEMSRGNLEDVNAIRQELYSIAAAMNERLDSRSDTRERIGEVIYYARDLSQIHNYLSDLIGRFRENQNSLDSLGRTVLAIETYIQTNFDKNISVSEIAEKVFLTPNYLCYLYKSRTGKTINQYIQEVRMEHARKLICESNLKIGSIARELGFANQNYFTRLFTKTYGDSPSQYRNKYARSAFRDN